MRKKFLNPGGNMMYEDEKNDKEIIDISIDDLQDGEKDRIVIESSDLCDIPEDKVYPQVVETPSVEMCSGKKAVSTFIYSLLWQNIIAGLVGGFLGWIFTESFYNDTYNAPQHLTKLLVEMGIFGGIIGGCVGLSLGAIEGIICRVKEKIIRGGGIGLCIGFGGGFFGGMIAQFIYSLLGGGTGTNLVLQIFIRGIGWSLLGIFVGISQGFAISSRQKTINGTIGGACGGAIGGLLFDPVSFIFGSGVVSRAVGISVMGASIGLGIGMVEEIRKRAWLKIEKGILAGKEFILYNEITTIGSSPKCDIVLFKDDAISPIHSNIKIENNRYIIYDNNTNSGTFVNYQRINKKTLSNNDSIQIGSTVIKFLERG
jgi:hypothetical protein